MDLREDEKTVLVDIAQKHSTNIQAAIAAAYEAGLLEGALRMTRMLANKAISEAGTAPSGTTPPDSGDDDDEGTLTTSDAAWLRAQGIDPTKKFRIKNSVFTITAVKRSRWKFPISGVNQNGTRYKFPIASVKGAQAR